MHLEIRPQPSLGPTSCVAHLQHGLIFLAQKTDNVELPIAIFFAAQLFCFPEAYGFGLWVEG